MGKNESTDCTPNPKGAARARVGRGPIAEIRFQTLPFLAQP
jgi:hypothetical protein